ncbi:MAG: proline racemase family protein, partial [Hyphomicrobiaceae bacterium]|nr:proline racemase family protein [Hyphomicrobiaceae bacterium]
MRVIDSHTEGEPTRTIIAGGPDLGTGPVAERARRLAKDHSHLYSSVILEPRGHDAIVGAMLLEPNDPTCAAGVIYFNPEGNLGMCGHGTIGLVATLAHMGRIGPGEHRIETPVGVVTATLADDLHTVSIRNVESYRLHKDVHIEVPEFGTIVGDVAWGGNWFFLGKNVPIALKMENIGALSDLASKVREMLDAKGITGTDGAYIDHIEFFGPADLAGANAKNFVLCPGVAYDRSPCGTGSSA